MRADHAHQLNKPLLQQDAAASQPPLRLSRSPADEAEEDEELEPMTAQEVERAFASFLAVGRPVVITMILASWVVYHITDPDIPADQQDTGISTYMVVDPPQPTNGTAPSVSSELGAATLNALVIIGFVAAVTFLLVALYYFECMRLLYGYIFLSSIMLFGVLGYSMWDIAIRKWELIIDQFTFYYVLVNFALVGVIAVFYQKGTPTSLTQGYLIVLSVIMAWNLKRLFPVWTTFALLVALALYDLCAVLTPCGPLKLLIDLVMKKQKPLPGLLYEANVNEGQDDQGFGGPAAGGSAGAGAVTCKNRGAAQETGVLMTMPTSFTVLMTDDGAGSDAGAGDNGQRTATSASSWTAPAAFRAQLVSFYSRHNPQRVTDVDSILQAHPGRDGAFRLMRALDQKYGTRVAGQARATGEPVFLSDDGRNEYFGIGESDDDEDDDTIKLGLGDFIFYSVLVSRAAFYGFATWAACLLVVLNGLGLTLVLLAVFNKALPALPISIALGVLFFVLSNVLIVPFLDTLIGSVQIGSVFV